MPKLRVLLGREVLKILRGFGFQEFSQRGSHIKVRRVIANSCTRKRLNLLKSHSEQEVGRPQKFETRPRRGANPLHQNRLLNPSVATNKKR